MSASSLVLTVALMAAQVPSPSVPLSPATAPHEPLVAPRASGERRVLGFTVAGTAAMVVGAGLWGVMVQGLVSGAGDTRDHAAIAAEVNEAPRMPTADERWWLDYHARFGRASNVQAVACGVLAGVFTVTGAALLGRAAVLRRRAQVHPLAWTRGAGVGWRLQF